MAKDPNRPREECAPARHGPCYAKALQAMTGGVQHLERERLGQRLARRPDLRATGHDLKRGGRTKPLHGRGRLATAHADSHAQDAQRGETAISRIVHANAGLYISTAARE